MMDTFSCATLRAGGFEGFVPMSVLRRSDTRVPDVSGVYVVCRESLASPEFLDRSVGGWFKDRDPSVTRDRLNREWVDDCSTLYVGRATSLCERIGQLARYAAGDPVGHWGGRLLWHLTDHTDLVVAWRIEDDPVAAEAAMIDDFVDRYGVLPFANLNRPRARLAA